MCFLFYTLAQNNSVLSSGDWFKISTNQNGIYKLTYSDLQSIGVNLSSSIEISSIKMYGNGGGMLPELNSDFRHIDLIENAIWIYDFNNNGFFENEDYLLFYGMSPNEWKYNSATNLFNYKLHLYSNEVFYFLTIDNQSDGKRLIQKDVLLNPEKIINSYNTFSHHELELENLISSGRKWYGERFSYNHKQSFLFSFPDLIELDIK